VLPALLTLALALRLLGHLDSGLWYDEIQTLVESVRLPYSELLTTYLTNNNHPLYSILARGSILALGESPFALRLPALVFGVLSVGMLYAYARRFTADAEALTAALLLATSYHHVWFSQNARGYTLLLLLTLASTWLFEQLLENPSHRRVWLYALTMGAAAYTHLAALFVAAAHGGAWLWTLGTRRRESELGAGRHWLPGLALLAAAAIVTLLYAPLLQGLLAFFLQPKVAAKTINSPGWAVAAVVNSLGLGLTLGLVALAGGVLTLACGAWSYARQSPPRLLMFLLPGLLVALPMALLGRGLYPRFFFFLAGFVLLLAVRGIRVLARLLARLAPRSVRQGSERVLAGGVLAALALAWLAVLPRAWALPKQDFEGALAWIGAHRIPDEPVFTAGLAVMPYARYYQTDFQPVTSFGEVERRLAGKPGGYLLSTLPDYLRRHSPDIYDELLHATRVARFRGSVGEGDVVIYRLEPAATP